MGCARCSILRTPFAHGALLFFWVKTAGLRCGHRCFGKLADTTGRPLGVPDTRLAVGCMGIMDILAPVALCIGAVIVAAVLYSIYSAIKERGERRREQEALRARDRQRTGRGKHSR